MPSRRSSRESCEDENHIRDETTSVLLKHRNKGQRKPKDMRKKLTANACATQREIIEQTKKPAGRWLELRPRQQATSTSSLPMKIPTRGKLIATNIALPSMSGNNRSRSNSSGNLGVSPSSVTALGCW